MKDIRPPEEVPALLDFFANNRGGELPRRNWKHLKKDGTPICVEVTNQSIVYNQRPARLVLANDVTEQKDAEDALRRSETLLRAFSDTMPQIVWGSDAKGAITYFNERAVEFLGLPPAKIRGEGWLAAVHPADRAPTMARWQRSLETGEDLEMQYRLRRADGVYRWHLARAVQVKGETVEDTQWCGTNTDLDEQLRAQQALAEAQRVAHMGSWSMLLAGREITWSAEMYRILGVDPDTFRPSFEASPRFVHPEDRARYQAETERTLTDLHPSDAYYRIVRPDGEVRVLHQRVAVESDAVGKPRRIHGTAQDVTELHVAEEQVRKQASLLDLAHDAILVRDLEDRVEFWNRGAERLYGWSAEEALGRSIAEMLYEETELYFEAKGKLPRDRQMERRTAPDAQEWRGGHRQLPLESGPRLRMAIRNPSSRSTATSPTSGSSKPRLSAPSASRASAPWPAAWPTISTTSSSPSSWSRRSCAAKSRLEDRDKFLEIVEASAQRGVGIVKQVLTFARGADGTRVLLQPIYLLQEIARIVQETFPKAITVQCHYPDDLRTIEADATQLHQVLFNLSVNARDAMPNGGQLTLSAENFDVDEHYASMTAGAKAGPHVLLQVTDTGTGISQEGPR